MDSKSPDIHFVIPCAGVGSRSGMGIPKQYADLAGVPMIVHTLSALLRVESAQTICLVVSPQDIYIEDILSNHLKGNQVNISVVYKGGDTRAQSVLAGLKYLESKGASKDAWVLVHDAARCLVTAELVKHLISNCYADTVGGLLAVPVADTLKQEEGGRAVSTISRDTKWAAQTPQMFRLGMLGTALEEGLKSSVGSKLHAVTDESSAIEAYGYKPLLVSGSTTNLKITYLADFEIAQAIIRSRG